MGAIDKGFALGLNVVKGGRKAASTIADIAPQANTSLHTGRSAFGTLFESTSTSYATASPISRTVGVADGRVFQHADSAVKVGMETTEELASPGIMSVMKSSAPKAFTRPSPPIASQSLMDRMKGIGNMALQGVKGMKGGRLDRMAGGVVSVATNPMVAGGLAAAGIAGLTGYGAASAINTQVNQHEAVAKHFNRMHDSLNYAGRNRRQDFEYNPMMTFSRPRVRGGHMGASGGLTLAMNSNRRRRR